MKQDVWPKCVGWSRQLQGALARYGCGALMQTFCDADDEGSGRLSFSQLEGGILLGMGKGKEGRCLMIFWEKKTRFPRSKVVRKKRGDQ